MRRKFSILCGNPPYQDDQNIKTGKRGGGTTLWDKFVDKSIDLVEDNGFLCLVHPCGWRNSEGEYAELGQRMRDLQFHYLEMHDSNDGLSTFGAGTSYDWYILQNCPASQSTKIKCQDGEEVRANLNKMPFIPSGMFNEIQKLLAKNGEERVQILSSYCDYESRKPWMSHKKNREDRVQITYSRSAYGSDKVHVQHEKDAAHPYPVVHNVRTNGDLVLIYSSHKNNGHFGVPKVIFGRRQCGTKVDKEGLFGLSQDCRGVLGQPEQLDKINEAMNNPRFIEICKFLSLNSTAKDKYDHRILSLFRKDFWKEFI